MKSESVYEAWDFSMQRIPGRSPFFSVAPLGLMNGMRECLTGFICRLGEAHSLSGDSSMLEMLRISDPGKFRASKLLTPSFRGYSGALNGIGGMASKWSKILSYCTLRSDCEVMTFLPWKGMISQRGLIRQRCVWCPCCYQDWLQKGETLYQPLIWCALPVQVCASHKCFLEEKCPSCHRFQNWLNPRSCPGYCSRCGHWLGRYTELRDNEIQEDQWEYEIWKSVFVESLISDRTNLQSKFSKVVLSKFLSVLIDKHASGSISRFAACTRIRKNTLWGWKSGDLNISLPELIKICYCCEIKGTDFLNFEANEFRLPRKSTRILPNIKRRLKFKHRKLDLANIRQILESESQKHSPLSLENIAALLSCSKRFLYKNFREICLRISSICQKRIYEDRLRKRNRLLSEIRKTVTRLHSAGIYPSRRVVGRIVRKFGDPNHLEALEALRIARGSLGID